MSLLWFEKYISVVVQGLSTAVLKTLVNVGGAQSKADARAAAGALFHALRAGGLAKLRYSRHQKLPTPEIPYTRNSLHQKLAAPETYYRQQFRTPYTRTVQDSLHQRLLVPEDSLAGALLNALGPCSLQKLR